MGIFKRNKMDAEENDRLVRKYLVSIVNVPANPPESPERDTGLGLDNVRQFAEVDARSGGWDQFATIALNSQFPTEDYIEHEIERRRQEHENTRRTRRVNALHLGEDAEHQPVSIDGKLTSLAQATGRRKDTKDLLKELEDEREKDLAVVEGRKPDATGAPWPAPVPSPPVIPADTKFASFQLAFRLERVKQWFIDIGLTLAALVVETIIVKESIELLIRDEGVFGYLYAIPPLLVATVLPHVIGTRLAYAVRRGSLNWQERAVIFIALPVWLATVYFLADIRRDATEYNVRQRIARESDGEYTAASVPQSDLDQQFNPTATLALWFCLIAAVGVSLLVFKLAFYNPYVSKLVKVDSKIAIAQRDLAIADREFERISGQIEVQKQSMRAALDSWDHYIDVILPSHALELKAHYRNCLVNAYGDPEMTGAILSVPEGRSFAFAEPPEVRPVDTPTPAGKEP